MPAQFVGLSYEKSKLSEPLFSPSNANLIGLCKRLGPGSLRIGGNSVDETTWNPTGPGQTSGETAPADVARLAAFLSAAGWPVLYGVNLAQSTPELAAAEVAYAAQALGPSLLGIEIGNEVDLYPGHYFPSSWDFADYLALWQSFASAILAQTPGVPVSGPVIADNTSWFSSFAQAEGKNIVLLSAHYYRANGQDASSNIQELISYPTPICRITYPLSRWRQRRSGFLIASPKRTPSTTAAPRTSATRMPRRFGLSITCSPLLRVAVSG
jgi:hypothetical protein